MSKFAGPSLATGTQIGYHDYNTPSNNTGMSSSLYNNAIGGGSNASLYNKFMYPFSNNQSGMDMSNMSTQDVWKAGMMNNMNKMNQGPSLMDIGSFGMNAYNMYKNWGFQDEQLGLAREQMGMAREQWDMTKDEVNRIAGVRKNITSGYNNGGNYNQPAQPVTA